MRPFWLLAIGILAAEFVASGKARAVWNVLTQPRPVGS